MAARQEFESTFKRLMGLPETSLDCITIQWNLLKGKPSDATFPLDHVYLMIGKEKRTQVIETLKGKPAPVQQLPALNFAEHYHAQPISFECHLDEKLPPARYLPLHLDLGMDFSLEDEYLARFLMVRLCLDVTIAFSQDHKMAASNMLNLFKSAPMEANGNQLFYQCVVLALFS